MKILELKKIGRPYFGCEDISHVLGLNPASAKVTPSLYAKQGILQFRKGRPDSKSVSAAQSLRQNSTTPNIAQCTSNDLSD
jgi:hypothetical protein